MTPLDRDARFRLIEAVLAEIEARYVFPDRARDLAAGIRVRRDAGAYDGAASLASLCIALTRDLREIGADLHLAVEPAAAAPDEDLRRARMAAGEFGIARVERRPGNLGFLELRYFAPAWLGGRVMSAAMTLLAERDALVVDLRRARGGDPGMIALVSSHLFDAEAGPRHLNDIHHRDGRVQQWWTLPWLPGPRFGASAPVCVLTSRETFSGAEEFARNLQALGRATIIGEKTAGGAHPTAAHRVAGRLIVHVPYAQSINPHTGDNWEGRGVQPDLETPAEAAEQRAVELLLGQLAEAAEQEGRPEQAERLRAHAALG